MNIKWIPIDKDNLYKQEVLAINTSHDVFVGYLEAIEDDGDHVCCTDRQPGSYELFHTTHYIPSTELVALVKEQHNNDVFITKEEAEEFSQWEKETGRGD